MFNTDIFHTPCCAAGDFYGGSFELNGRIKNCYQCFTTEDATQMQHLRFPTPPITPPKLSSALSESYIQQQPQQQQQQQQPLRTQSVIMQVGRINIIPAQEQEAANLQTVVVVNAQQHRTESEEEDKSSSGKEISCSELRIALIDRENCSYSTSSASSLEANCVCQWLSCDRSFENLESLAAHISQIHAVATITDGLYHCRWRGCTRMNRGFNARYKMLVHVRTHTKEKPHQCHLCKKSFSRAENLKIHIRSHSGEKPYVCTFKGCQKAYSNSSDRFKHSRTHAIEKPYVCKVPGCQKRYTDPSSLRKHVKTFKHNTQIVQKEIQLPKNKEQLNTIEMLPAHTVTSPYYLHYSEKEICHPRHHIIYAANIDTSTTASYMYAADANVDIIDLDMPLDLRLKRT